jgi:hypothetical protein
MIRKLLTDTLSAILQISTIIMIGSATVIGWHFGAWVGTPVDQNWPIFGAAVGFLAGVSASALTFGVVFVLRDIQISSRAMNEKMELILQALERVDQNVFVATTNYVSANGRGSKQLVA